MSDDHRTSRYDQSQERTTIYSRNFMLAGAYRRREQMMTRARLRRLLADPALSKRRPLYLVAGLLALAAFVLQYSLLLVAALLVLAVAAVPEIWYVFGLRGLTFERAPEVSRVEFGGVVETPLVMENRSALPLPFVEMEDNFPDDVAVLGMTLDISPLAARAELIQTMGLWAYQRVRRRYYLRGGQRGAFTFGPTIIKVTDPFGVITREETLETARTLIVHPLVAPLEEFGLSPKAPFGDHASRMRLLEDPLRVSGVRQYLAGDDPRRIHWKATARTGALQSKVLDPSTQRTLMIALDVRTFKAVQMGYDPALSELAISAAASVARWAFDHGYAVGLISNGALVSLASDQASADSLGGETVPGAAPRLRLDPSARPEWQTLILDGLARLLPYNGGSLAALLTSERRTLPPGASLVYIGLDSLVDVPTLVALREIRAHGRDVTLLLTAREDEPEGDAGSAERQTHNVQSSMLTTRYIGGRSRWRALEREALGALGGRKASARPNNEHLELERELIQDRRRLRQKLHAKPATAETEDSDHADSPQDETTGEAADAGVPSAAS